MALRERMTAHSFAPAGTGSPASGPLTIRVATDAERSGWDELVDRFGDARLFHRSAWLGYLEAVTGARPLHLVLERDGAIVGVVPGLLATRGFVRIFGSPMVGWQTESMGPVFDRERADAETIARALPSYLWRHHGVMHVEILSSTLDAGAMERAGFRGERLPAQSVPLTPGDEDAVLRRMKGTTRNQLRKAIKLGLIATIESDESFVDEFYDQTREVFARRGNAVPFPIGRVRELFRRLRESGHLLAVAVRLPEGECVATGLFMHDGRELHLWGWTHRTRHRASCPTELLVWTAMQHAMAAGCTSLDMAGGGDAKAKFGAVGTESYRWCWSRYAALDGLRAAAGRLYRWQQRARGAVTRWRMSRAFADE